MPAPTPSLVPLRITIVGPIAGVLLQVQRGRSELLPPSRINAAEVSFDFTVRLGPRRPGASPNFLGEFVQGPPSDRFIYVNAGTRAGQAGSCWDRRAKIRLKGVTWTQIESVLANPGVALEARIASAGKDGGPTCAAVPLLGGGWAVTRTQAGLAQE